MEKLLNNHKKSIDSVLIFLGIFSQPQTTASMHIWHELRECVHTLQVSTKYGDKKQSSNRQPSASGDKGDAPLCHSVLGTASVV